MGDYKDFKAIGINITYTHNMIDRTQKKGIYKILKDGYYDENPRPVYSDGTPAHTYSINHVVRQYDLQKEFPITTLRYIAWKSAVKELLWIYQDQSNNLATLNEKYQVHYWNDWESKDEPNTIGQRYGATVKNYDQINKLLKGLKEDPFGRRHIIDLYQFSDFEKTDGLFPCAFCSIWNVRKKNNIYYLDMMLVQRSGDYIAASGAGGINEVQYAVLQHLVARHCGYKAGKFTHVVANEQIYDRHVDNAKEILKRDSVIDTVQIKINEEKKDFFDFTIDDIQLIGYDKQKIDEKNPQLKFDLGI